MRVRLGMCVLVSLLACGAPRGASVEPPRARTPAAPEDDAIHAATTLRRAGAEPRRPLAYRFAPVSTTIELATDIDRGGAVSTFLVTLVATVKPKVAGATIDLHFARVDVTPPNDATPAVLEKLSAARTTLLGRTGSFEVDAQGVLGDVTLNREGDNVYATFLLQELAEVLVVPLPTEGVGLGAEWTLVETKARGATLTINTSAKLLSRDDATAKVEVTRTSASTHAFSEGVVADNSTSSRFEIVLGLDRVARRIDGFIATTTTMRAPNQPEQSETIRVTRHASSN